MKQVSLMVFLKGSTNPKDKMPGCSNIDQTYGGCITYGDCLIEQGKPCDYFEQSVLPTAKDIGQTERITALYNSQVGIGIQTNIRPCPDCQGELKPRQRYCDNCTKRRRLESKRKSKQKAGLTVDS